MLRDGPLATLHEQDSLILTTLFYFMYNHEGQTLMPLPTIGQYDRTLRYDLLNKFKQTFSADIWNLLKTYAAKTFRFTNLYS